MDSFAAGPRNLITDVAGLEVGCHHDAALRSGVTVLTAERPFTASVHIMGGAPGTRDAALLAPDKTVQQVDALVLSGGSAFGLAAADAVMAGLRRMGRGFDVGGARVPIVPGAILFDLLNGGDKDWDENPYHRLGRKALEKRSDHFPLGAAGAGYGAICGDLRGGLGSASLELPSGHIVGALVAVNALGQATVGDGPHFWAAPFELDGEFGGLGPAPYAPARTSLYRTKLDAMRDGAATTIAIVATDADLTKAQCARMAVAAHDGLARALVPAHTPFDGDLVFSVATGSAPAPDVAAQVAIGAAAAHCLSRAVAQAVYAAAGEDSPAPSWRAKFG